MGSHKITKVTVYQDRAQVTREMKITSGAGVVPVCFEQLPPRIDQNSIQVKGTGNASILDVKFSAEYLSDISEEKKRETAEEIQTVRDAVVEIEIQLSHSSGEKKFVENIVTKLTAPSEKEKSPELDPEKWIKMVQFYRQEMEKLDGEISAKNIELRELKKKLAMLENMWKMVGSSAQKVNKKVWVTIEKHDDQAVSLSVSYMVLGPKWIPNYELRVDNAEKTLSVHYQADVYQNTGEDWEDVEVELSTAAAHHGGQQPEMEPIFIQLRDKIELPKMKRARAPLPEPAVQMMTSGAVPPPEAARMDEPEPEMLMDEAVVSSQATSVVFRIPVRKDIVGNNQPHRVKIVTESFPAYFRYSTVPRLDEHAYLKAKTVNNTDYPFLPGEAKVFMDGQFIANTGLELINPQQEFWVYLGIDNGIEVKYRMVNLFEKKDKIIGKKKTIIYQYKTEITNHKNTNTEIVIWDQIPISKHEELVVTLNKPAYKQDSEELKMNDKNYLEWRYEFKPGQKREIELEYSIDFPGDKKLVGIQY